MELKEQLFQLTQEHFHRPPDQCDDRQLYEALLLMTRDMAQNRPAPDTGRKLYYFSAEFLIGKLLSNNLLALGLYDKVKEVLAELGRDLGVIESMEPEPSLGNGGLGRLAACFLDSIAALGLPGDGVGLNYHYGLFKQEFLRNKQSEEPNPWIEPDSWLIPTQKSFTVPFGGFDLKAVLYDIAIPGARNQYANRLHLFDVEEPANQPWVGINFDKTDIAHNLTSFLYPDDSDEEGRLLRVYQQYFMVSAGAQLILDELKQRGFGLKELADHVVIQINDTHPSMVIPELIRLLTQQGLTMDEAVDQVSRTCAYTNHTILAEALEKWPLSFIERVAPQLVPIIVELDRRVKEKTSDARLFILDDQKRVHMAHMDIHYGFSVNGVAALHRNSEALRAQALLRSVPRPVQQQNQRCHLPPLAGGLQSGTGRVDRRLHRHQLAGGCLSAGEADGLRRGRCGSSPSAAHQAAEEGSAVPVAVGDPGHRVGPGVGV